MKKLIIENSGQEVFNFISQYCNFDDNSTFALKTRTKFNIENIEDNRFKNIVNLKKINDIRRINKFFEAVNNKIPQDGIFIGKVETIELRNKRLINKYLPGLNYIYVFLDFIFKRIFPKLPFTKKIYFFITQGRNRVLSKAETFGRLYACGFTCVDEKIFGNRLYFVFKKVKKPCFDQNPSYGPVFKMKRIGKNGRFVYVYKFRTMYPYSEYLQDFIKQRNGFSSNGKLANDLRVTSWGKFMRKYWIDELPQLINVFRGEMNIVGVRPLSESFMREFPDDIKTKRQKYKPGCLPPYVALLKQNVKEYIESERIYLAEKEKHPYFTDIKYFTKCIYNITTNKIRSA